MLKAKKIYEILGFNPRSREGSDRGPRKIASAQTCFNPRSREGSDVFIAPVVAVSDPVSIHAPVKGATTVGAHCQCH